MSVLVAKVRPYEIPRRHFDSSTSDGWGHGPDKEMNQEDGSSDSLVPRAHVGRGYDQLWFGYARCGAERVVSEYDSSWRRTEMGSRCGQNRPQQEALRCGADFTISGRQLVSTI